MSATVDMADDLKFTPEHVTIKRGGTVTWTNSSGVFHTATEMTRARQQRRKTRNYRTAPSHGIPGTSTRANPIPIPLTWLVTIRISAFPTNRPG